MTFIEFKQTVSNTRNGWLKFDAENQEILKGILVLIK